MSNQDVPLDFTVSEHQDKMPRPYVRFEWRPQEVRDATGNVTYKDVGFVHITAAGGKDSVEKIAEDWFLSLDQQASAGRLPGIWPSQYRAAFEQWKKSGEIPLSGTPIKTWSALSPAQIKNLINANVLTIEDLANINDEGRSRIGLGGDRLIKMAQNWLTETNGPGAMMRRLEAIEQNQATLEERNQVLEADNQRLQGLLTQAGLQQQRPELSTQE